jgi:transcriptional regulator with XRE-family HTH domain
LKRGDIELAEKTGFKQPQIARIESGDYLPTLETLWKLADVLGAKVIIGPRQQVEIKTTSCYAA